MWLSRLDIKAFGKLSPLGLGFGPGLNVVCAADGQDLATVAACLEVVLFGLGPEPERFSPELVRGGLDAKAKLLGTEKGEVSVRRTADWLGQRERLEVVNGKALPGWSLPRLRQGVGRRTFHETFVLEPGQLERFFRSADERPLASLLMQAACIGRSILPDVLDELHRQAALIRDADGEGALREVAARKERLLEQLGRKADQLAELRKEVALARAGAGRLRRRGQVLEARRDALAKDAAVQRRVDEEKAAAQVVAQAHHREEFITLAARREASRRARRSLWARAAAMERQVDKTQVSPELLEARVAQLTLALDAHQLRGPDDLAALGEGLAQRLERWRTPPPDFDPQAEARADLLASRARREARLRLTAALRERVEASVRRLSASMNEIPPDTGAQAQALSDDLAELRRLRRPAARPRSSRLTLLVPFAASATAALAATAAGLSPLFVAVASAAALALGEGARRALCARLGRASRPQRAERHRHAELLAKLGLTEVDDEVALRSRGVVLNLEAHLRRRRQRLAGALEELVTALARLLDRERVLRADRDLLDALVSQLERGRLTAAELAARVRTVLADEQAAVAAESAAAHRAARELLDAAKEEKLDDASVEAAAAAVATQLRELRARVDEHVLLETRRASVVRELRAEEATLASFEERARAWLTAAGYHDEEAFRQAKGPKASAGGPPAAEALSRRLGRVEAAIARTRERLVEEVDRARRLERELAAQTAQESLASLTDLDVEEAKLLADLERLSIQRGLLAAEWERFVSRELPRIITLASSYLGRLTGARLVHLERADEGLMVRDGQLAVQPVDRLGPSDRMVSYLAFRLAALERHAETYGAFPVIVKDPFEALSARDRAFVGASLAALAERTQVLLLTSNPEARRFLSGVPATFVELPRKSQAPAATDAASVG